VNSKRDDDFWPRSRRVVGAAIACSAAARVLTAPQNPASDTIQVQILSPGEDAYVSGPTLLRGRVEPQGSAKAVAFFVDGRQICVLATLPYECECDAGPSINEHQVRLVVSLVGGGRIVQTVRTKGVAFAEKVDVDVVQVT
jgi:Bacterial Ig domain